MLIPVKPTFRARIRARIGGSGPVGPAAFGAALVIALGFGVGGPETLAGPNPSADASAASPRRARITRPPALGRFAVSPVLLRRLDGTVDGGRAVHGPGGATADTSAVRLGYWLFQDVMGRPRREAPWGIVMRPATTTIVLGAGVVMPPALTGFRFSPLIGGIDYSDPLGVNLPLVWVQGFENHALTDHYHVRDFASRDGAPFARISPDLVGGLERLSRRIGQVSVISGYRHPVYNRLRRVGGALFSRHQAGQAADVWSATREPIEIARAAIETMGCGIGIGLGPTTVHIDVRGALSTWTYRGAALSEASFDLWAMSMCRGHISPGALHAAEVRWLAAGEDREEWSSLMGGPPPELAAVVAAADSVAASDPVSVLYQHGEAVRAFARASYAAEGAGVVVADLRDPGSRSAGASVEGRLRFVRSASPEARFLRVSELLDWVEQPDRRGKYLVYALKLPNRTAVGVLPLDGPLAAPAGTASPPAAAVPDAAPAPPPDQVRGRQPPAPWVIVLSSTLDRTQANEQLTHWRSTLAGAGVPVALQVDGSAGGARYRVTAGRWATAAEAQRGRQSIAGLPAEAWVLQAGR